MGWEYDELYQAWRNTDTGQFATEADSGAILTAQAQQTGGLASQFDLSDWIFGPLPGEEQTYGAQVYAYNKETGALEKAYELGGGDQVTSEQDAPRWLPESMLPQAKEVYAGRTYSSISGDPTGAGTSYNMTDWAPATHRFPQYGDWQDYVMQALPIAGMAAFGGITAGAALGASAGAMSTGALTGATMGAGMAAVEGENVLEGAAVGGVTGAAAGALGEWLFGGALPQGAVEESVAVSTDAGMDFGGFADGSITELGDTFANDFFGGDFGAPSDAEQFLMAESGQTMTDVGPGMFDDGSALMDDYAMGMEGMAAESAGQNETLRALTDGGTGTVSAPDDYAQAWEGMRAESAAQNDTLAAMNPPTEGGGFMDSALKFAKENPLATVVGMNLGGNILSGISQQRLQQDRFAHERALMEQKIQDQKELEAWRRQFTQSGSYFDARPRIRPAADQTLRRLDGTAVFGPGGVINRAQG